MATRPDETWHRLVLWTGAPGHAERLAAAVLHAEGYRDIDPTHPLGGPDGGKDARLTKNGQQWIMAVYFPTEPKRFSTVKRKFVDDFEGVSANGAGGMAFVTNQRLAEAERDELAAAVPGEVDVFHVDRVAGILDRAGMEHVRSRFLTMPAPAEVPLRTMREVFDGPRPNAASEQRHSLYDGMLMLGVGARPVPDLARHPSAASPAALLAAAAGRAAQVPAGTWPPRISLVNEHLTDDWRAIKPHLWTVGWRPTRPDELTSRPSVHVTVRLHDVVAQMERTWPTAAVDDHGHFAFHAAHDSEVVAELLVALGFFHGLFEESDAREVDVAVLISAAPRQPMVTSRRVVSGGRFGEVAGYIREPRAEVPTYHQDVVRVETEALRDPFTVADELVGGWLTQFRDDDLVNRLRI